MRKKINPIFTSFFVLTIIFIVGVFAVNRVKDINNYYQTAQVINSMTDIPREEESSTTLFFVGDMMLTRGVKSSVDKNFGGDYGKLFDNLSELKNADILFGNLEGDVSDVGNNVGSKYSFRMDPVILPTLKNAGFDIVSFANNHVGDWNTMAFKDTLFRLESHNILKTGAGNTKEEATNPTIIEKNGIKFGFLGFSDVGPNWLEAKDTNAGILLASDPDLENIIKNAKAKSDVLIISFHWGEEYKFTHNKRQEELAYKAIDSGADMIIGHHPHVIQDTEIYNGKLIVYSLGNFIFDQNFRKETMYGMFLSTTFTDKKLTKVEQKIIPLNKKFQPEGIFSEEEFLDREETQNTSCPEGTSNAENILFLNVGQDINLKNSKYIPNDLIEIDSASSTRKGICLIKTVKEAFESMANDAKKSGITIKISSGFRSYETQRVIFNNSMERNEKNALVSVAKAGYSEHQLGTAMDITGSSINYSSATSIFDGSPEDEWLKENAYLYGFIQSYPKGKEDVTGYKYEPWHYRYVGVENAKKIKDSSLTITEFLE